MSLSCEMKRSISPEDGVFTLEVFMSYLKNENETFGIGASQSDTLDGLSRGD